MRSEIIGPIVEICELEGTRKIILIPSPLFAGEEEATSGSCQVSMSIDEDGNVSDPSCVSKGCTGKCSLKSELTGKGIRYWCECGV
ncbi:hypothetical protein D3C86_714140 [compost metagenome]